MVVKYNCKIIYHDRKNPINKCNQPCFPALISSFVFLFPQNYGWSLMNQVKLPHPCGILTQLFNISLKLSIFNFKTSTHF